MEARQTRKTAILVDGGYYRKRSIDLWGRKPPEARADELYDYCLMHITEPDEPRDLYRIFYYDCPPMERKVKHPLTGNFSAGKDSDSYKWSTAFYLKLCRMRKVALRMGELAESQATYVLKNNALESILKKQKEMDSLLETDFILDVKQKGVDMRIGLDAASLAYGKHVDQIVLIAGDSDFVPVAKMARRNGIDFILDPMKHNLKPSLLEHIDGIESFVDAVSKLDTPEVIPDAQQECTGVLIQSEDEAIPKEN